MTLHTHDKRFIASQYGRFVVFLERPIKTRQKDYREPLVVDKKWHKTAAQAKKAKQKWERQNATKH